MPLRHLLHGVVDRVLRRGRVRAEGVPRAQLECGRFLVPAKLLDASTRFRKRHLRAQWRSGEVSRRTCCALCATLAAANAGAEQKGRHSTGGALGGGEASGREPTFSSLTSAA